MCKTLLYAAFNAQSVGIGPILAERLSAPDLSVGTVSFIAVC